MNTLTLNEFLNLAAKQERFAYLDLTTNTLITWKDQAISATRLIA